MQKIKQLFEELDAKLRYIFSVSFVGDSFSIMRDLGKSFVNQKLVVWFHGSVAQTSNTLRKDGVKGCFTKTEKEVLNVAMAL